MTQKANKRKKHGIENDTAVKKRKTKKHHEDTDSSEISFFDKKEENKVEKKKKEKNRNKMDEDTSEKSMTKQKTSADMSDITEHSKKNKDTKKMDKEFDSSKTEVHNKSGQIKNKKKTKKKMSTDKISTDNSEIMKEGIKSEKTAKDYALSYLKQWKKHREEWKFQKVRQVWLLTHMYDSTMVSDKRFKTLLKYLDGMKGIGRQTTSTKAQEIIESDSDDVVKLDRAKQIVQQLSTE